MPTMPTVDSRPSSSRPSHRPAPAHAHAHGHTSTPPRTIGSRSSSRTALQGTHHNIEPPSTPQNRGPSSRFDKGKGRATVAGSNITSHADAPAITSYTSANASPTITAKGRQQQTGRQTLPESNVSPIEESSHHRGQSWSSVTRDSVVDNLLLSFDRMPGHDMFCGSAIASDHDDFDYAATPPRLSTRAPQRPRGHTYSSSLSTDMASVEDTDSFYSRNLSSRGKRSNSSTSFKDSPASMPRIRDDRDGRDGRDGREGREGRDAKPRLLARSSSETARTARNTIHSRTTTMKSAANSSFDYGYGQLVSTTKNGGLVTRSSSKDNVLKDNAFTQSAPDVLGDSVLSRGRPVPSQFSAYEMYCPEPHVPGGPRTNPGELAPSASQSSLHNVLSRLSETSSPNPAQPAVTQEIPQSIRDQASDFVRAANMRTASPSLADQPISHSAAAASGHAHPSAGDSIHQRPGFFRRVFGSSNRSSSAAEMEKQFSRESSVTQDVPPPPRKKSLPAPSHIASQMRPDTRAKPTSSPVPGVINKKPSSFFRRRKKSLSEDSKPPVIPPHILNDTLSPEQVAPTSPGSSSLRKVLDQFMEPGAAPASGQVPLSRFTTDSPAGEDDSDVELFHSGYTPPPDASLRRNPLDHVMSPRSKSAASVGVVAPKPRTPPDANKLEAVTTQKESNKPGIVHSTSFLSDTSDGDADGRGTGAPSFVSAVSESYALPGNYSMSPFVVSPLLSPMSETPPGGAFFTCSSSMHSDDDRSPGATIRPVADDDYGVVETKGLAIQGLPRGAIDRLWIDPGTSLEDETPNRHPVPLEVRRSPRAPPRQIATQDPDRKGSLPVVEVNGNEVRPSVDIARQLDAVTSTQPTEEDIERAKKIYDGEEDFIPKLQAAPWLGEKTAISSRTLAAYMGFYDLSGQNILNAMRRLCEKLTLKGESQQVDRILDAFSRRWHECNPNNGFRGPGVVHNICYALLLLNTDQHIANIQHKMTRSEFIKNTMPAIKDAAEKPLKTSRQNSRQSVPLHEEGVPDSPTIPHAPQDEHEERTSNDFKRSMKRLSIRPGVPRLETDPGPGGLVNNYASNLLINFGYEGSERGWLIEVENVLKSFYSSIVSDALPLHGANEREPSGPLKHANTLSVATSGLRRTGSVISKAPSEGYNYRGRKVSETQSLTQRWQSKNRPRQKIYPASTVGGSSRTSFEDGNSALSPAGTSMWSRISSGRTQPTMSVESFALNHDFKQSLGFTNALSQAIIREETIPDTDSFHRVGSLLEDESLELAGAPWAKEGMVKHKHHLEGPEKKAKERSWHECFAVVEKGYLHLFAFNRASTKISSGGARARRNTTNASKTPSVTPSVVGGGNWTDNAEELGQFLLRQTIATTLPVPGYSKTRPHVWALSLPTGAVHLFQVGTGEIAEEFASTVNYWSARLSKEPLVGGIDNIEYGWSDNILNPALISSAASPPPSRGGVTSRGSAPSRSRALSRTDAVPPPVRSGTAPAGGHHSASNSLSTITNAQGISRPSMQSSLRTSLDQSFGPKPRLPGDRAAISDWRPPGASMLPSQLLEIDQLRSLKAYITSVEAELEKHNELRNAIPLAYSGNGTKLNKVMANWEKKSSYLLREVIKFRTYIEALEKAVGDRERVYEERRVREEEDAAIKKRRQNAAA